MFLEIYHLQKRRYTDQNERKIKIGETFNNLLLIRSGPVAMSLGGDFRPDSTSCGLVTIVSYVSDAVAVAEDKEALVLSRCVCSLKIDLV